MVRVPIDDSVSIAWEAVIRSATDDRPAIAGDGNGRAPSESRPVRPRGMTISEYRELVARLPDPDPGFARDVAAARAELRPPRDANAG